MDDEGLKERLRKLREGKIEVIPDYFKHVEDVYFAQRPRMEELRDATMLIRKLYRTEVLLDDKHPNQILRNKLWIGSEREAKHLPSERIKAILSLGTHSEIASYPTHDGIDYMRIEIPDSEFANIAEHFALSRAFIKGHLERNSEVLVHCGAGISRSATICIAYLMQELGLSFLQAYICVYEARPQISPNMGFVTQLVTYDKVPK